MKKFLSTLAIASVASLSFTAQPFAAEVTMPLNTGDAGKSIIATSTVATDPTITIGKLSSNVMLRAVVDDAGTGYTMVTVHKNGTKAFGTAHDSTAIYTAKVAKAFIGKLVAGSVAAPTIASAEGTGGFYVTADDGTKTMQTPGGNLEGNWAAM